MMMIPRLGGTNQELHPQYGSASSVVWPLVVLFLLIFIDVETRNGKASFGRF